MEIVTHIRTEQFRNVNKSLIYFLWKKNSETVINVTPTSAVAHQSISLILTFSNFNPEYEQERVAFLLNVAFLFTNN